MESKILWKMAQDLPELVHLDNGGRHRQQQVHGRVPLVYRSDINKVFVGPDGYWHEDIFAHPNGPGGNIGASNTYTGGITTGADRENPQLEWYELPAVPDSKAAKQALEQKYGPLEDPYGWRFGAYTDWDSIQKIGPTPQSLPWDDSGDRHWEEHSNWPWEEGGDYPGPEWPGENLLSQSVLGIPEGAKIIRVPSEPNMGFHGSDWPVLYHPQKNLLYVGPKDTFHWDMIDADPDLQNAIGPHSYGNGPPPQDRGLNMGRLYSESEGGPHIGWFGKNPWTNENSWSFGKVAALKFQEVQSLINPYKIRGIEYRRPWIYRPHEDTVYMGPHGGYHGFMQLPKATGHPEVHGFIMDEDSKHLSEEDDEMGRPGEVGSFHPIDQSVLEQIRDYAGPNYSIEDHWDDW